MGRKTLRKFDALLILVGRVKQLIVKFACLKRFVEKFAFVMGKKFVYLGFLF